MDTRPRPLSWLDETCRGAGPRQALTGAPYNPDHTWGSAGTAGSGVLRLPKAHVWEPALAGPPTDGLPGGWMQVTSPPSRGPRVFWGVPAPGYDSEWSPGGWEGTPRSGQCSESLHALLLREGRARALGCQPRLVINQPLSRSSQSSGVWTRVTCGHNNAWSHVVLPPCDSDLTRAPLHLHECLSATCPPLPGLRGHTVNRFSGFPMFQHEDGAVRGTPAPLGPN